MQKHSPVKYRKSAALFTRFCADMEILPSYTPIFLIDSFGRIVNKRSLVTSKEHFESVYNLVCPQEISFIHEKSKTRDAFTVKGNVDDGRNFIVISKDKDGFSRCVVCSFSEDKCIRLDDYVQKLCTYKDYLDSFSNLAFSPVVHLPAKRIFKTRISGALSLVELASGFKKEEETKITFPVSLALEKLCAFAGKANDGSVVLQNQENFRESVVNVPESFFRLMTSAIALVLRHSINGKASVSLQNAPDNGAVRIILGTKSRPSENDIYEKSLICAFRQCGFECGVFDNGSEYVIFADAPLYERAEFVLSDVAQISQRIDYLLSDGVLSDMYDTIRGE